MVANLLLAVVLVRPLSYGGLALATGLSSIAEAALLVMLVQRRLPGLLDRSVLLSAARSALAALLMGVSVLAAAGPLQAHLASDTLPIRLAALVAVIGVGVAVYLAAALVLGSEEVGRLRGVLARGR
jgi:putative peptidoglycan lipid II flippase